MDFNNMASRLLMLKDPSTGPWVWTIQTKGLRVLPEVFGWNGPNPKVEASYSNMAKLNFCTKIFLTRRQFESQLRTAHSRSGYVQGGGGALVPTLSTRCATGGGGRP